MRIVLPPSETKRPGGGNSVLTLSEFRNQQLNPGRIQALLALRQLSSRQAEAKRILKLSDKQLHYLQDNTALTTSPTMPAIERYTGVLYDALDVVEMDARARAWVNESVSIQSALFGLIDATDQIPSYRLSASTTLPGLSVGKKPATMKNFWQYHHARVWDQESSFVLDLRSKDYVALNHVAATVTASWVNVVSRAPEGQIRALNHFNKTAKGELVRVLARSAPQIDTREDFLRWTAAQGIECELRDDGELVIDANSVSLNSGQSA